MPRESDDTKKVIRETNTYKVKLKGFPLAIFIFFLGFLIGSCCVGVANGETLPKTYFAWTCGEKGETLCFTNDTKKVPGVFGVSKFETETLRPLIHAETPKYHPYFFRGAYMPTVILPKKEKYTVRRERRQLGDINKPVYVVVDEAGNEVVVSESGGRPLYIEPGRE